MNLMYLMKPFAWLTGWLKKKWDIFGFCRVQTFCFLFIKVHFIHFSVFLANFGIFVLCLSFVFPKFMNLMNIYVVVVA